MAHARNHQYPQRGSHGPQRGQRGRMPSVGATFYPGADDYMMPELSIVSPSPQRVMPEMPVQIADSLKHLELEANAPRGHSAPRGYNDSYATPPPSSQGPSSRPMSEDRRSSYHSSIADDYMSRFDEPPFSPFPRLINPGPNIPPSDEEKENQIEGARMDVLSSNDPEMQLVWAQDALNYVEIAMNHYTRIADPPGRPRTPPLEHQIKTDATNVVGFLADQHHPRAEFMRGSWLEFGKFGFPVDKKEAFRCYARSAEKGYSRAEYRMGMQFENSNEPQKAIARYERGARQGDSASNYRLGMMTLLGQHGQRQDYAKGCELIQIAAENADENAPQGAYVYGMLIARELPGIEVPEGYLVVNMQLAREMIEKAAFLGFARAQLKMGTAYELCQLGCDFNPALSLHYNALAARQGEAEAEMAISKWFLCGHDGVFEKNEQLAYEYAKRAAASGLGTAEFAIGYFYEIGMYVNVDLKEAQRWYSKAAEHGNKDATGRIDGISRSKTLSRKDHDLVAIAQIRSRHGSQRNKKNPLTDRRPAQPSLPPAIEDVEMPNIPGQYNYHQDPQSQRQQFPPRSGSVQPLNTSFIRTDSAPPPGMSFRGHHPPNIPPWSGAAPPYPTSGRTGTSNGLTPGNHGSPRSSSAVGYGPSPRPPAGVSLANRPFSVASGRNGMATAGAYLPPRADTAMGLVGYPPQQGPFRTPSGSHGLPPGPGRQPYPGPQGPQGYPPNTLPPDNQYGQGPDGNRPPPVEVGYIAPPLIKPPRSPAPRPPKSPAPPARTMSSGQAGRIPAGNGPQVPMSPGSKGFPTSPSPKGGSWAAPPQPSPPMQAPPEPPLTPKPLAQAAKPGPKSPAPKKGPQSFEEMGVPQPQKEQDCVIM